MKTALFLILVGVVLSSGYQDKTILRQVYKEIKGYNSDMQIDKKLERLAQSHGCIKNHAEHKSTDAEALAVYGSYGAIIQCANANGGCTEGAYTTCGGDRKSSLPKVWTKKNPTFLWDYCQCQNEHMKNILDHSRMGCSAAINSAGKPCIFCYLGKKKCCEAQFSSCEDADNGFLSSKIANPDQCGKTCEWDPKGY